MASTAGFVRETSNKIWGFYGEVSGYIKSVFNEYVFLNLNIIGLQICALAAPETFYEDLYKGYFSNPASRALLESFNI